MYLSTSFLFSFQSTKKAAHRLDPLGIKYSQGLASHYGNFCFTPEKLDVLFRAYPKAESQWQLSCPSTLV